MKASVQTMHQVWITRHGPPDVFELREAAVLQPSAGEVLIRVAAAGINFADIMARLGLYPDAPKPPCVVGYEVAGEVAAVGPSATAFAVGSKVIALTRLAVIQVTPASGRNRFSSCRGVSTSRKARHSPSPIS